jgi:integrase
VQHESEAIEANKKTATDARLRYEAHIRDALGDMPVAALTTDVIRRWHIDLAKKPARVRTRAGLKQQYKAINRGDEEAWRRRRVTANRVLTTLRAALNRAWKDGKVTSNAEWSRVDPFESVDTARIRYLQVTEAQRLINATDPDFRQLVQAALETGARYGELTRLQVHDFNRDTGTLAIRTSKSGKGRHIVLTEEGAAFFRQLCAGRPGAELMLLKASGKAWARSEQGKLMRKACEIAKITPAIGFHGLRHTWASLAVMGGMPLLVVAKNLGHRDTRMVEMHYGHMAPSYIAEAVRAHAPRFGFKPESKLTDDARNPLVDRGRRWRP